MATKAWHAFRFWRVNLRQRLTGFALLLISLSMGTATIIDYQLSRKSLEQQLGRELLAIVISVAPLINGDDLMGIDHDLEGEIIGREEFDRIRSVLIKVKAANGLESNGSPLYIMRPAEDFPKTGELEFVVMTDRDEHGRLFVGNRYAALAHNREALAGKPAATGVYEDPLGLWISASAPVRDSNGDVAGIIQADRPVRYFYEQAREKVTGILMVMLASLAFGSLVAGWMARGISRPVQELVTATQCLARGQLDRRVSLRRSDELGDLESSINTMAVQLQAARDEQLARQEQLTQALHGAEAANVAKGQFLATMSHELRTPLNGIMGFAGLLRDSELTPEQQHAAGMVELSGKNLLTIVDDILDYSKIEAGRMEVVESRFELASLLENSVEAVSLEAKAKGLELACWVDDSIPAWAAGDPLRLRQILLNVLGNAVKFTSDGEVVLRAHASTGAGNRLDLTVSVRDTGIGMDTETQNRLFRPFSQADGSTTRKYGGTGLGLSISQRLAEQMEGAIRVESDPGHGSLFVVTVRLGCVDENAGQVAAPSLFHGARALIVGGPSTTERILMSYLSAWQIDASLAANEVEALEQLRTGTFPVAVLSAASTAEMLQLADALRSGNPGGHMEIVLLVNNMEQPEPRSLMDRGISECISKPLKKMVLRDALARAYERYGRSRSRVLDAEYRDPANAAPTPPSVRILLVEDNLVNSQLALGVLRKLGHRPDHAKDGVEAVKAAGEIGYDLILMDCQMPEMDGYDATRLIRLQESVNGRRARIVAMTANALAGDREKCLEAGMDDYIPKPFRKSDLMNALAGCPAMTPSVAIADGSQPLRLKS